MTSESDIWRTTPFTTSPSAKFLKLTSYMSSRRSYSSGSRAAPSPGSGSSARAVAAVLDPMGARVRSVFSVSGICPKKPPGFGMVRAAEAPSAEHPTHRTKRQMLGELAQAVKRAARASGPRRDVPPTRSARAWRCPSEPALRGRRQPLRGCRSRHRADVQAGLASGLLGDGTDHGDRQRAGALAEGARESLDG